MSQTFFKDLPSFSSFTEACNAENYHPAPADWFVVLTDVQGSTKAIQEGRYKDVNMVGAACITAAVNACGDTNIPYVFGGDGATFLIPPQHVDAVKAELLAVKRFSQDLHGLSLRAGIIPISEIRNRNKEFGVAKFVMPTGAALAMFNGGGISLADELLKNDDYFAIQDNGIKAAPCLEGLSCRWHPIPARRETILTLLIMSTSTDPQNSIFREINALISQTLDADQSPVHQSNLSYKWPTLSALRECRMVWKQGNIFKNLSAHVFLISLFNIMNKFNLSLPGLNVPKYKEDMIINSDYRKFDDMLRMVVDCTQEQARTIENHLENMHAEHQIVYGTHYSDTALMTCFVKSLQKDAHVHFIDGNNGGYALAAKQMKERLSTMINSRTQRAENA